MFFMIANLIEAKYTGLIRFRLFSTEKIIVTDVAGVVNSFVVLYFIWVFLMSKGETNRDINKNLEMHNYTEV